MPRRWRTGLHQHPNARRQIGVRTAWAKVRQIFFAWWVWGIAAITALVYDNWDWAIGTGLMASFAFLIWPREVQPRVGLEHEFSVDDDEFLTTIAGSTGIPFFEGNAIEILNNGDEFYPAMLKAIAQAQCSITIEAYIYWGPYSIGRLNHRTHRKSLIVDGRIAFTGGDRRSGDRVRVLPTHRSKSPPASWPCRRF